LGRNAVVDCHSSSAALKLPFKWIPLEDTTTVTFFS